MKLHPAFLTVNDTFADHTARQYRAVLREAHGNLRHPSVEKGVVTSVNDQYVFVRFGGDTHSKACHSGDLY